MKCNRLHAVRTAVFILSLVTALACSGDQDDSKVLMTVNGTPITEGEFQTQWKYECAFREIRNPGDDDSNPAVKSLDEIREEIFEKRLIPMAAVKARYGERIPEMMERMEAIKRQVSPDRSNFGELAAKYSKDTNASSGGSWRTVTRYALYYPVPRLIFSSGEGDLVGPFISLVGCHLMRVERKMSGMLAMDDTAVVSHILLPFDETRLDFLPVVVDQLVRDARIEAVDPECARYVPQNEDPQEGVEQ